MYSARCVTELGKLAAVIFCTASSTFPDKPAGAAGSGGEVGVGAGDGVGAGVITGGGDGVGAGGGNGVITGAGDGVGAGGGNGAGAGDGVGAGHGEEQCAQVLPYCNVPHGNPIP